MLFPGQRVQRGVVAARPLVGQHQRLDAALVGDLAHGVAAGQRVLRQALEVLGRDLGFGQATNLLVFAGQSLSGVSGSRGIFPCSQF